ncbi:hypothetical protein EV360DRAFT_4630, partial [Lentinula raphanica]
QVRTILAAYTELGHRVTQVLQLQLGDVAQLQLQEASTRDFLESVMQHQHLFDPDDYDTMVTSVQSMLSALEQTSHRSEDITDHTPIELTQIQRTGRRGRPKKVLNQDILEASLQLRGPTHLAPIFDCSARTVRRRALEYGIVDSCPPVYVTYEDPE